MITDCGYVWWLFSFPFHWHVVSVLPLVVLSVAVACVATPGPVLTRIVFFFPVFALLVNPLSILHCVCGAWFNLFLLATQEIDDLSGMPALTSLWLGRNKIGALQGLDSVPNLQQLGLQSNRLTTLGAGLAPVVGLRELYVSHNGLTSLEGIGHLVRWVVCAW